MKISNKRLLAGWRFVLIGLLGLCPTGMAAPPAIPASPTDVSFKNELQIAINRGLTWLEKNQDAKGHWSNPELPALTAMALMCFKGDPAGKYDKSESALLKKGYAFLLANVKPDGGIYQTNYVTYNTALGMMALLVANKPDYEPIIRKARQFLVGLQTDFGEAGKADEPFDGGIGYGSRYKHSDMGNTLMALEALYYSRHLTIDKGAGEKELNYEAAIHFLQSCQNLPSVNKQDWVSDDPKDKGGFVYYPGHSMAGGVTNPVTGKVALRSYGSISYGGMLSYLYANLKKDDSRVKAVLDWLRGNYSLNENPGMGPEGLFFYYHTMTKALSVAEIPELQLTDGKRVAWRKEVAMKLLNLQNRDGSWANENGRWMEKDPVLVTAYAVMSLEMIYRSL
jgi:squalene-hopene/tetraprenyl-beta-curcumene cyclase